MKTLKESKKNNGELKYTMPNAWYGIYNDIIYIIIDVHAHYTLALHLYYYILTVICTRYTTPTIIYNNPLTYLNYLHNLHKTLSVSLISLEVSLVW